MLRKMKWARIALIALLAAGLLSGSLAWAKKPPKPPPEPPPIAYSVTWFDPLPGDDSSEADGMNNNGVVVGRSFIEAVSESSRGFISYVNTSGVRVTEDLNDIFADALSDFGDGYVIYSGKDINDNGQIVGGAWIPSVGNNSFRAYRYTPGEGELVPPLLENLGLLDATTGIYSYAVGVNESGDVIGRARNADTGIRGFFYSDADGLGIRDIGDVGGEHVYPQAINNLGQVVGWDDLSRGYTFHLAFIYTSDDGISGISSDAAFVMSVWSINDLGVAVGKGEFTYAVNKNRTRTVINPARYDSVTGQIDDLVLQR